MTLRFGRPMKHSRRSRRARLVPLPVVAVALVLALGPYLLAHLRASWSHNRPVAVLTPPRAPTAPAPASGTTTSTAATTPVVPTTPATTAAPTTPPTTAAPTTTSLPATKQPVAVPGGTFLVISGQVRLTHVVVAGDTLYGIASWFKLVGGDRALYDWNRSAIGRNPALIFPGEILTITVPAAAIPHISPVWLAETRPAAT